jgi:6-phosphogluconolactonase
VNGVEFVVHEDERGAVQAAAEMLARAASEGSHIALSGGNTVGPAFELAALLQPDWSQATVWWGDDRAVPPHDERSNYLLARRMLFDRLSRPPAALHRIRGELGAEAAAAEYDALLDGVELGLALNGIGPDGHTASLFPNAPALEERERRAVPAEAGLEPFVPRVTMTLPVFNRARKLVFLVTGGEKADIVGRAFSGKADPQIPASLVRGRRTIAVLDRPAARLLETSTA